MIHEDEERILKIVNYTDYQKGMNYDEDSIELFKIYTDKNGKHFLFYVESQSSFYDYDVNIVLNKGKVSASCDCPQFAKAHSCKHLAACLISYSNEIFKTESPKSIEQKSKQFFKLLKDNFALENNREVGIRKSLNITCELQIETSSYNYWNNSTYIYIKAKIGDKKMYSLNKKFTDFLRAYRNGESFYFGKDFTYDPDKYYIPKEYEELFDYLEQNFERDLDYRYLDDRLFKKFIKINKNVIRLVDEKNLITVQKGFFFHADLKKENDKYRLNFNCDFDEVISLTTDNEYLLYDKKIYQLNKKERYLYEQLKEEDLKEIIFNEEEFADFKSIFLPYIKNQITVDESVPNLVITKEPKPKFYFDLDTDFIESRLIFDYDGYEASYRKTSSNETIFRDEEFENKTFEVLTPYGFHIDKDKILLEDLDDMADFLETGLEELSQNYSVYTSENLKQVKIVHKPSVSTTFHLGMDRILNYHLELEGVDESELTNLFQSLKLKKKYYRLKSGDLLDLTDESMQELENLKEELDLDDESDGKIPKFRALYLASLKKNSKIIETNDTFDEFIATFEKYKNAKVNFTKEEKSILRDYQFDGVRWLYTIYNCGFGGILADEMGLGKSLQTITFLKKIIKSDEDKILIVCPTSLVYNWENEFKLFAPEMKRMVFSGNKVLRKQALEEFKGNIYITSYGLLKEDFDFYKDIKFKCFFIDEAQQIKNPIAQITKKVKKITADAKFALTGTPIENSVLELWSIFDFIMPGFLANMTNFQSKYKINPEFDEDTNKLLDGLKNQIKPFLLRRKKSDVAKDLPDKIENNIFIDFDEDQKKIYAGAVNEANKLMNEMVANGGFKKNKMVILSLLTKLRQICIHPSIVIDNYKGSSVKITELIKVVKEVILNGHKILLFTSFRTALDIVKKEFDKNGITSYTIAGDVPSKKRLELVESFNKDDTNVFLIMLKSGGTGLNLTSADVVIHLDLWWNPQAENQATDRTHRIGQTHSVDVVKLICKNTVEERILELQTQKKQLSDKLIESGTDEAAFIRSLSEQDIRNLLKFQEEEE